MSSLQELVKVEFAHHQIVFEKAIVLEAIGLDQDAVTTGMTMLPAALIHCAILLKHPAESVSLIILELTLILDTSAPLFASNAAHETI